MIELKLVLVLQEVMLSFYFSFQLLLFINLSQKILNYFKGQYSMLLQYEILEKLVTYMSGIQKGKMLLSRVGLKLLARVRRKLLSQKQD